MDLISVSVSLILEVNARKMMIVCFSSRNFAGISEPVDLLETSRNIMVVSLAYLSCEPSESRLVISSKMRGCNRVSIWKLG